MGLFFNEFHKKKSLSEKCSVIIYILPFWHKRGQKRFYFCSEIHIFSSSNHLELRAGLSNTILKVDQPGTFSDKLGSI
jgi:hypothetical protein